MMIGLSNQCRYSLLVTALFSITAVFAQIDSSLYQFKSRPDLYPAKLNVTVNGPDVTQGYIFFAPYQTYQNTALLYDTNGNLIWTGFGMTGFGNTHDFRVCPYNGSDHICFYSGNQYLGYARGQGVIMDNSFSVVTNIRPQDGAVGNDQHEMHVLNGSAYVTIYEPIRWDLSHYNITTGEGWIMNSRFQEIDVETGDLLFDWQSIEHIALEESYVGIGQSEVAGTGFNATSPWDYFHINSIDRNSDGDFLVSGRHTSTFYKISGQDGSVIWRCGGKMSDFQIEQGLNWSSQHDARWHSSNASTDVISIFDNASNGYQSSATSSAGLLLKIDHSTTPPMVSLIKRFNPPDGQTISASQGNFQILNSDDWANSGAILSWGSQPVVTEHDSSGNIIWQGQVALNGMLNYRAYKFNFTSNPRESPALYTYAQSTDNTSSTVFYMSWNGATELRQWRVYGRSSCTDQYSVIDTVDKTGFETTYEAAGYIEFGMVEALGPDGKGIRNSTTRGVKAFVPNSAISGSCNSTSCSVASSYNTPLDLDPSDETASVCAFSSVKKTTPTSTTSASSTPSNVAVREGPSRTYMVAFMMMISALFW